MKLHAPAFIPGDIVLFRSLVDDTISMAAIVESRWIPKLNDWYYIIEGWSALWMEEDLRLYTNRYLSPLPAHTLFEVDFSK